MEEMKKGVKEGDEQLKRLTIDTNHNNQVWKVPQSIIHSSLESYTTNITESSITNSMYLSSPFMRDHVSD